MMINNEYIKEAIEQVVDVMKSEGIEDYDMVIDLDNPKLLYLFVNGTYVKVNYLYKVSRVSEKHMYMSLLSFINLYPEFLKDIGVKLDFVESWFVESDIYDKGQKI